MKPANNGPLYAGSYADIAELFRSHGYALAVHGSVMRDFDLIAVPWTDTASVPHKVIGSFLNKFAFKMVGTPDWKDRRYRCTFAASYGEVALDISFVNLADCPAEYSWNCKYCDSAKGCPFPSAPKALPVAKSQTDLMEESKAFLKSLDPVLQALLSVREASGWHAPGLGELHDGNDKIIGAFSDLEYDDPDARPIPTVAQGDVIAKYVAAVQPEVISAICHKAITVVQALQSRVQNLEQQIGVANLQLEQAQQQTQRIEQLSATHLLLSKAAYQMVCNAFDNDVQQGRVVRAEIKELVAQGVADVATVLVGNGQHCSPELLASGDKNVSS